MGTEPHAVLIIPGSAYSVGAKKNNGRPANLRDPDHYPVEAICTIPGCGQVVRREKPAPAQIDWMHTGRMPGEPG